MRNFLMLLMAAVLLGAVSLAGYMLYKSRVAPPVAEVPASASSQLPAVSKAPPKEPKNELQRGVAKSTADPQVLEKLMYDVKKNPDTVGWLQVPGTDIDNSVVQYHNNNYYLRRDERGKDSVYGCYFADYESSVAGSEDLTPNTVIYGHSDLKDNPDGPKFSQLFRFVDSTFAKTNRVITLSTPEEKLEWEVFAVFYTDISFNYICVNNTAEVQKAIIDKALSLSIHDYGIKPKAEEKVLTLSTCSVRDGNDGNHRFVVMARLKQ